MTKWAKMIFTSVKKTNKIKLLLFPPIQQEWWGQLISTKNQVRLHFFPVSELIFQGLTNVGIGSDGNTFFCEFDRPKTLSKNDITYDLADGNWFVLIATGAVSGTQSYHGPNTRAASSISWKLSDPPLDFFGAAFDISMMKIHAILMFIAWGIFVPSGYGILNV